MQTLTSQPSKPNRICAYVYISESELDKVLHWQSDLEFHEDFPKLLHSLGLDINKPYEKQENIQHRNRFNEVVTCSRWVGDERLDPEWINSPYLSQEAKDKVKGSMIVEDTYRSKMMTEDVQYSLERKERRSQANQEIIEEFNERIESAKQTEE